MGRLEDKMLQASGVAMRVTTDLEARADAVIAREAPILKHATDWSEAKHAILDDAEKAITKAENALRLLANDPLPVSETSPSEPSSPAVEPPPVAFQSQ